MNDITESAEGKDAGLLARAQQDQKAPSGPVIREVPPQQDPLLYTVVLCLTGLGIVMVYSASAVYARQRFGSPTYFLSRCVLWNLIGLLAMALAARVDFSIYKRLAYPLLGATVGLLTAVLFVGVRINGARRWFHLLGVSFQPAELAKLSLIIYIAYSLSRKAHKVRLFTVGFLPHLFVCGVIMLLLLKQPDLGTAVIAGCVTLLMLFVAGTRISYILLAVMAGAPVVYQTIVGTKWRLERILAYLDPWQYRYGAGYQVAESLISIGSGGLFGLGLGDSKQKLFFLPEAHTDYIMSIVGEELGFLGFCAVALAFVALLACGCRAAYRARDAFGCYLAFGITSMLGLQAAINMGVVLGSLPTKGLPLPFVSFGGSSLVIDLFAAGILLNISRGAKEPMRLALPRIVHVLVRRARTNRRRPGGGRRIIIERGRSARADPPHDTVKVIETADDTRPEPRET